HLQRTIALLGEGERRDVEIDVAVALVAADKMTARRLIAWVPEAFGFVLLPHVGAMTLPTTFTARAGDGTWKEFALDREPIFADAVQMATALYRDGPRATFSSVARRSALVTTVNDALNAGRSLDGTPLAGPALVGIPAEFYEPKAKSFWKKLVG
ncbi:MAG: hypothetical protein ABJD97_19655, partial [Betaproteobacteria bacterium]